SLMSVTVAPGITPPCASFTVPVIVPVTPWAATEAARTRNSAIARAHPSARRRQVMDSSPVAGHARTRETAARGSYTQSRALPSVLRCRYGYAGFTRGETCMHSVGLVG